MSQKSNKKHGLKKPPVSPGEMFPTAAGARPVDGAFTTAAQLAAAFPFAGLDDAFLRARANPANPNPRTGLAWIPKPRGGKYDLHATILGLLEWFCARAAAGDALPRVCNSMKHAEEIYYIPYELMQYVRSHGGGEAFEASNRVKILEVLRHAAPLLKKIFSGGAAQIKGVEGMEDLDSDCQLARVRKEDADERARENALANKNLFTREGIEEAIAAPLLAVANQWKQFDKDTGQKLQAELVAAGLSLDHAKAIRARVTAAVEKIPADLRASLKLSAANDSK